MKLGIISITAGILASFGGQATAFAQSDGEASELEVVSSEIGISVDRVGEIMREAGYSIAIDASIPEAPVIYSEIAGLNFVLVGFNCAEVCREFLFSANFDVEEAPALDLINAFNAQALAGRAFLDEDGTPSVEHLFTMSGDDPVSLTRNLEIWESVLLDFADYLTGDANVS